MKKHYDMPLQNLTVQSKLILIFLITALLSFVATMYMNGNINQALEDIDRVYTSNAQMNELAGALNNLQNSMKEYLDTKTSMALTDYYQYQQEYSEDMNLLNEKVLADDSSIMEKNIRSISVNYLEQVSLAVKAKRARNISQYKIYYDNASQLYDYLNAYIFSLNNEQFKRNSSNYITLAVSLRLLERVTMLLSMAVALFNIILLILLTDQLTKPLRYLAEAANQVALGNFDVSEVQTKGHDEISVVAGAFNKMVVSIKEYIIRVTDSIEAENAAKERELLMKNHLKDAQLKYYQAQIHPHFLFNSLNAGAQLAMMENAEKTYLFVQKMSEFFRTSMNSINTDVTLREELLLVENYLYIMNVRFSKEINYEQKIYCDISNIRVPSMILQPLVENSIQYGIRDIEWEGHIDLTIEEGGDSYWIKIQDNGVGLSKEKLEEVRKGRVNYDDHEENSNGIGLGNVMERLKLYYQKENLFTIDSEGEGKGVVVTIEIPKEGGNQHV
ncbi:MAG: two-component system, sensor histidine kinase YesM [Clostridiales bacterium]|nr:two-component system, sensor histidine kinase YesM [Clostridiales bacterium]